MPETERCPCCPKHCALSAPHCSRGAGAAAERMKRTLEARDVRCPGCARHCRIHAPLCDRGAEALNMVLRGELKL